MKHIAILYLAALFSLGCLKAAPLHQQAPDPPFHFDAADEYFFLVNKIKEEGVLHTRDWESFLAINGNHLFVQENNMSTETLKLIRKEIETVYIAENDSLLKASIDGDIRLQIRNKYKENEQLYKKHITRLKSDPASLKDSIQSLTQEYLPPSMHKVESFPQVYFHALWNGSASPNGVFVDIILAYDFDQKRLGSFIAHELHHYMRKNILEGEEIDSIDQGAIWAIENTFNEGLADMVDKAALVYEGSDWWLNEQYMALLNYAGKIMNSLDGQFKDEWKGKHHTEDEYREVLAYSVGHIPGQHMAQLIKDQGRLSEVIEQADDPFAFFFIYQEEAKKVGGDTHVFSNKAIEYIKQLRKKYVK